MRALLPLLSLALLVLSGCAAEGADGDPGEPQPDPPELLHEYTTEHFRVHSDVERCAGDLARWEAFVDFAEGYLGVEAPGSIDLYVWDEDALDSVTWCGDDEVEGCFRGGGLIYGEVPSVEHELVHAITENLANTDRFFVEGLAEAIAEDTAFGMVPLTFPVKRSRDVDYPSAGHFVRWLLESAGPELFLDYMAIADAGREDLETIYGEDVELGFYAEAQATYPPLYEHPAPNLDRDGDIWSSELIFDCSRDDVRGRAEGLVVVREWVVEEPGFYALWTSVGGMLEIRQRFTAPPNQSFLPAGTIVGGPFAAGTYEISIVAPPGTDAGTLQIWLNQASVPTWPESP